MQPVLPLVMTLVSLTSTPTVRAEAFLSRMLVSDPATKTLGVKSYAEATVSSTYDVALAALWLMHEKRRDEAGQLLAGLATRQHPDGALPFSFPLIAEPHGPPFVRTGAMAWAGYAAVRYLNDAPGGPHRDAIARMAHRTGEWLLARQVRDPGDPRDGLITGGNGRYHYARTPSGMQESLVPEELRWVSTEHNLDAYFFLRDLGAMTRTPSYTRAADRLSEALSGRLWDDASAQFVRGLDAGPDRVLALDCAAWGVLFLLAIGDEPRARRAFERADARYRSFDPATGVKGYRPYADKAVYENPVLAAHEQGHVPEGSWSALHAVWPEGTASMALAAWRLGEQERARTIIRELEGVRDSSGGLPCLTREIPFEFTRAPGLAGTAWTSLVRAEMESSSGPGLLWLP